MSDVVSSPDKSKLPPPRTTYAGRMKKKRQEAAKNDNTEVIEDSEDENDEKVTEKETIKSPPASKRTSSEKTFVVPETPASANRKPLSKTPSIILSSASKHTRNGSLSSVQDTSRSHTSPDRTESISDAESVATIDGKPRRKRKGEPERIQFFKDDPWCQEVEPHRALCKQCGEWQDLHPKRRYVMQGWLAHKKTCSGTKKSPPPSTPKPVSQVSSSQATPTPLKSQTPSQNGSTAGDKDKLSPMEAEGKATLENDFRTGEIRPHEVFCTQCAAWVKLYPTTKYSPKNWLTHVQQCPGAASSSTVPSGSELPSVSPKAAASSAADDASSTTVVPSTPSIPSSPPPKPSIASNSPPPPPSLPLPSPSPLPSRKRPREDSPSEEQESPTKRQVQRPRTEAYKPPVGRALWDLVTKPVVAFVRGFVQGVVSGSAASGGPDPGTGTGGSTADVPVPAETKGEGELVKLET